MRCARWYLHDPLAAPSASMSLDADPGCCTNSLLFQSGLKFVLTHGIEYELCTVDHKKSHLDIFMIMCAPIERC